MSRDSTGLWNAISAISVTAALASCAGTPGAHGAVPQEPGASPSAAGDESTRSIRVVQGELGFDHSLQVRRSKEAPPHELHDNGTVMTGDRIRATVVTSEDAYLYVAFCMGDELTLYPPQRGVRTAAGASKLVPEGNSDMMVDGEPGTEVLYLIVSRTELSLADPHLSAKLAAASQEGKIADCGASLDAEFAGRAPGDGSATAAPPSTTSRVLRGRLVPKKRMPAPHPPHGHRPADATASGADSPGEPGRLQPVDTRTSATPQDEPDFIRNPGTIVWYGADGASGPGDVVAADADGIAVVRYRFAHVAPPGNLPVP
jgi:hypothetical protein